MNDEQKHIIKDGIKLGAMIGSMFASILIFTGLVIFAFDGLKASGLISINFWINGVLPIYLSGQLTMPLLYWMISQK